MWSYCSTALYQKAPVRPVQTESRASKHVSESEARPRPPAPPHPHRNIGVNITCQQSVCESRSCCRSQGSTLELMQLPLACFSPQTGTAGGDPPALAGVPPRSPPSLTSPTTHPPSLPHLPSARPHSGCILHGRGGECGSSRRWRTTVMMSQAHICCPRRRAGGGGVGLGCGGSERPP